jgi:signal transduction histidine kinase
MGDITDRKEREQRLMVLNRVLRHNLRNKLTAVTGYAGALETVLEAGAAEGTVPLEEAEDHLDQIKRNANDLVALGEKARQFEQAIESTDITGTVEVRSVLADLAAEYRDHYPDAEITVEAADLEVRGNARFLELAVGELIDNALSHNDRDEPTVSIEASAVTSEQIEITIVDDGPGIPEMERKTLTEGEESSLLHGSGVGLWTVNWLVTRIGGHVSIADSEPRGTVVTLSLPATAEYAVGDR